jgi:hypothetical protein
MMANSSTDNARARLWATRDAWLLAGLALALRLVLVAFTASRFFPAEDGKYYQIVAGRIARGLGYTWLWPDGVVTYAAHYPVGYPAILGGLYAMFGPHPALAMALNAVLGSLAVVGVYRLASTVATRRGAIIAGAIAALHPTLLFYTPAVMTEIVSASLLAIGAWVALLTADVAGVKKVIGVAGLGLLLGIAVLVRPQQMVFAPVLGWLAMGGNASSLRHSWRKQLLGACVTTAIAVACCLPWTFRNCERMGRCMLVSANAGWNLLIGTAPEGHGAWVAVDRAGIPPNCRNVFDEAKKDVCFGDGAVERIHGSPLAWAALMPSKLARTFDDVGTPGFYLHSSNGQLFPENYKTTLAVAEVIVQRAVLLLALAAVTRIRAKRRLLRNILLLAAAVCVCLPYFAWVAVLLLAAAALTVGLELLQEPPLLLASIGLCSTAIIHAVFFGGARYAMVTMPWTIALSGSFWRCTMADRRADA